MGAKGDESPSFEGGEGRGEECRGCVGRGSGSTGEEGSASEDSGDGSGSESGNEYYDEEMGTPVGVRTAPVRVHVLVPPLDLASFLFPVSARVSVAVPVATLMMRAV